MELRNFYIIILGIIVVLGLIVLCFVNLRKDKEYKGGKKVADNTYVVDNPYFKKKVRRYKIYKIITTGLCILAVAICFFLLAGPYQVKEEDKNKYNRDIILCIDVSASVDETNLHLVGELKETVKNLQGERFGIVIFNTTPVTLIPLTTDYEYVISQLDLIEKCLDERLSPEASDEDIYQWMYMQHYMTEGTMIDSDTRGGSNIGDGLAASAYEFSEEKENEDRTKIIIFSTDNQLAGTPIFTLEEAASICKEKNIVVFGIGTEFIGTNEASSMKAAMEETGGKLYIDQSKESLNQIVENIETTSKSLLKDETEIRKVGIVKVPFILLVITVSTMLILLKVTKR